MHKSEVFLTLIFFFFLLAYCNLATASTLPSEKWEELKVYQYVIQEPSPRAYSIVGIVLPIKDNSPYIDENESENFTYARSYEVCINVHVEEGSQGGAHGVTLGVYTCRECFPENDISYRELHYQVLSNGYIVQSPTEVGLFPFYIVGFENKELIEKRGKDIYPYFGYSVGEIGGNFVQSFRIDNVIEEMRLTYFTSEDEVRIDSPVAKFDTCALDLQYRWRVPVTIGGILPAKPFPLTPENCDYYLIGQMEIPGTQNYVDFLKSLPPTGYEEPTWELNIPPALIVVAVVIVALIIYVSISRLRAGRR